MASARGVREVERERRQGRRAEHDADPLADGSVRHRDVEGPASVRVGLRGGRPVLGSRGDVRPRRRDPEVVGRGWVGGGEVGDAGGPEGAGAGAAVGDAVVGGGAGCAVGGGDATVAAVAGTVDGATTTVVDVATETSGARTTRCVAGAVSMWLGCVSLARSVV